jgi:probable rRNA maturation factor
MLKYTITDPHQKIKPNLKQRLRKANLLISKQVKDTLLFDVSITNDEEIKQINHKYRKINKVTDVISFAFHDAHGLKTSLLGEIFINYQQAQRQAKVNFEYEIIFLFVHGLLHLLGYDHNNKTKENQMFNLQNKIMKDLNLIK